MIEPDDQFPQSWLPEPEDEPEAPKAQSVLGLAAVAAGLIAVGLVLNTVLAYLLIVIVAGGDASIRECLAVGIGLMVVLASIRAGFNQT